VQTTTVLRVFGTQNVKPLGQGLFKLRVDHDAHELAQILCEAMEQAGLSIEALAEAVGTTPKSVWRWRQGVVPRRVDLEANVVRVLGGYALQFLPRTTRVWTSFCWPGPVRGAESASP
jgi:hypothetical protein